MVKPTPEQAKVETMFPAIARWVGELRLGRDRRAGDSSASSPGPCGRAGTQVEDDRPGTLAEAMAALEAGLTRWFEEQGIEPE